MKAIVNTAPNRLEWLDWPTPEPQAGQVLIRTGAVGICATDVEMIAGWDRTGFPSIPGHEWSGTIVAVGAGVDAALTGQRCVAENVWTDGGEVGFEHPGAYGQYFVTEAACVHRLPDGFPFERAALIEPTAVCVRALRRLAGAEELSEPALILGDGAIGLLMTALLSHNGLGDIVLVGGRAERLRLAGDLGACATVTYHDLEGDLATALLARTNKRFMTIAEASGSSTAMQAALQLAAPQANIVVIGDYAGARADFPWNHLLHRELRLIGSNASAGAWPEAVRLVVEGHVPVERLITHRFHADRFADGFALVQGRDARLIKAVLDWNQ